MTEYLNIASKMPAFNFTKPEFIDDLREQMLKFTYAHVHDKNYAEDVVQEALLSAYKNSESFTGQAAFKTWVFAILKNKMVDVFRSNKQCINLSSLTDDDDETLADIFNEKGGWHKTHRPKNWQPDELLENSQFWLVLEICLNHLPAKQAYVFMMREFIELDSLEICEKTNISESNLNVLMYRARLKLRQCLENKWLNKDYVC